MYDLQRSKSHIGENTKDRGADNYYSWTSKGDKGIVWKDVENFSLIQLQSMDISKVLAVSQQLSLVAEFQLKDCAGKE